VAKEAAAYGVRANVICPGFVRTPLVEKQIPEQAKEFGISEEAVVRDIMLRDTVDGEFTTVDDVAHVALTLAAFETNALTGQSLGVSHGWCRHYPGREGPVPARGRRRYQNGLASSRKITASSANTGTSL